MTALDQIGAAGVSPRPLFQGWEDGGMARTRARSSEVHSYVYIKNALKELGWDTRNPSRAPAGQVYTQNECLEHPEIQARLNQDRPEYVVKITETDYWVIEAKREQSQ